MSSTASVLSSSPSNTTASAEQRGRFFLVMSGVLLTVVLIGFAHTLYLRALFDVPPIPAYLYFHGTVLTSWFVWLFLQSAFIGAGRTHTHRRLGVAALILGPLIVIGGLTATLNLAAHHVAGHDWNADAAVLGIGVTGMSIAEFIAPLMWANFASLVAFVALLAAALLLRRRPQAHKRLMLLASLGILGPAVERISEWPVFLSGQVPFVPLVMTVLLLAIVAYDLYSTRRVHPATIIGGAVCVLTGLGGSMIGGTAFGQSLAIRILG